MKGASHPTNDVSLNPSSNESIQDVIHRVAMGRRQFLQGGVSAVALASAGGLTLGGGMLAGGCAVGAGLSGAAIFTITAWVTLVAMWGGAALTDRLVDQRPSGALDQPVPGAAAVPVPGGH